MHRVVVNLETSLTVNLSRWFEMILMIACAVVGKGRVIKNEASALGAKRKYVRRMVSSLLRKLCETVHNAMVTT